MSEKPDTAIIVFLLVLLLVTCPLAAADGLAAARTVQSAASAFDGLVIDSVEIDNRNIYDTDREPYDRFVFKAANKLHYRTREAVIKRELLLGRGDRFSQELAEESSRNLRQRLILYDAWIETERLPNGKLLMRVVTIDQWSLSGGLNLSRDGNEVKYNIGVRDRNFLGNNQFISSYYYHQQDDDDYVVGEFTDTRFFGYPYRVDLDYSTNPEHELTAFGVSRPYYNLNQALAYSLGVLKTGGRRDTYRDDAVISESFYDGDIVIAGGEYRFGSYLEKLKIGTSYRYRYERNSGARIFSPLSEDSALAAANFPVDSVYHRFGAGISYSDLDYVKLHQIDGFGFTEDFALGYFTNLSYARAFEPGLRDHLFDVATAGISRYFSAGSNLVLLDYNHSFWFQGGDNLRHSVLLSGKYYRTASEQVTLAIRAAYRSDWHDDPVDNLVLGGTTGIRGFEEHYKTGDRRMVMNLESRFFPRLTILSLRMGGVVFTDFGNLWRAGAPLKFRDFSMSAGVGLRLAFEKSSRSIVRIDLAYSDVNDWELSIGTGQYFLAQPAGLPLTSP